MGKQKHNRDTRKRLDRQKAEHGWETEPSMDALALKLVRKGLASKAILTKPEGDDDPHRMGSRVHDCRRDSGARCGGCRGLLPRQLS